MKENEKKQKKQYNKNKPKFSFGKPCPPIEPIIFFLDKEKKAKK
jgi:hypothetical protein